VRELRKTEGHGAPTGLYLYCFWTSCHTEVADRADLEHRDEALS
jgi:hypothetical protein